MNARYLVSLGRVGFFCAALVAAASATPSAEINNQRAADLLGLSNFVLPEFPGYLSQIGITEGSVAVAIGKGADGSISDVLILESTHERFSEAAAAAVRQWKFAPPAAGVAPASPTIPLVRFQFFMGGAASVLMPTIYAGKTDMPKSDEIALTAFDELDRQPAVTKQVLPAFPAELRRRGVTGAVTVSFFVDTEGRVRTPVVTASDAPEFSEAVLAALRQWTFETPKRNGKAVNAIDTRTFNFGPSSRRDS